MMRFDQVRFAGCGTSGFDNVRINRALREPLRVVQIFGFLFENLDEQVADGLALVFRITQACKFFQETLLGSSASTRITCTPM
jgi:hypothetical protein